MQGMVGIDVVAVAEAEGGAVALSSNLEPVWSGESSKKIDAD
jgi:hypothetical protein